MIILKKRKRNFCPVDTMSRNFFAARQIGHQGFTLVELIMVVAIIGALAMIALPNLTKMKESVYVTSDIAELGGLRREIAAYQLENDALPPNLNVLGVNDITDVHGNPYQYLVITPATIGAARLDEWGAEINTFYDLYSLGIDGVTDPSRDISVTDDVVIATDGSYIGLGSKF